MYRDVVQWSQIRNRILVRGISRRQIVRETGISSKTVSKMLVHTHPQLPAPKRRNHSKLGPHTASIQRMLQENATLPPRAKLSVRTIYQRIRDDEGFSGGYNTVADYARSMSRDEDCIWENIYDVLMTLDKKGAIDFLSLLSRDEAAVISPARTKQFLREAARTIKLTAKPDKREAYRVRFEWMRSLLQKEFDAEVLCHEIGDVPDIGILLHRLYNGRLSDRNRAAVVLAGPHGLSQRMICNVLRLDQRSCSKYPLTFERGGAAALFPTNTKSNPKLRDGTLKKGAVALLHVPPSNYDNNP